MRNAATILAIHTRPTGEPCAVKAASTVREGAVGKGLVNSTSLAAYFARIGSGEWSFGGPSRVSRLLSLLVRVRHEVADVAVLRHLDKC